MDSYNNALEINNFIVDSIGSQFPFSIILV